MRILKWLIGDWWVVGRQYNPYMHSVGIFNRRKKTFEGSMEWQTEEECQRECDRRNYSQY